MASAATPRRGEGIGPTMKTGWKRIVLAVAGLGLTVAVLGGIKAAQISAMMSAGGGAGPPPEVVSVRDVAEQMWLPSLRATGTVVAVRSVLVSTEVPGLVLKLGFDSGDRVAKGKLLVQLDTSIERAELESALAGAELAEASLRRAKGLSSQRVNSPAELDSAQAEARQAQAAVGNIRAQIAKKTIRAPFSGRLGIRQVDLGQILTTGTPIVRLQDLDRVYVDFYLPQQDLGLLSEGQTVLLASDVRDKRTWEGVVETIESSVEISTRNVRVRAVFENKDGALRAGMSVRVQVALADDEPTLVVPATAVVFAPYGNSVYVVEPEGKTAGNSPPGSDANGKAGLIARQKFVELGERRGDFVAVVGGLEKGERVVSAGAFKLRDGASVIERDSSVDPQLSPHPRDS